MPLAVSGTIGIDTVYTPNGDHREGVIGGSCTYFAAAAAVYGPVRLVGAVGEDFPDELRAQLTSIPNIDLAGLETRAGSQTFRWGGKYLEDMDQRETLFTELGVLEEAPPAVPEAFKDTPLVFLGNMHPGVQADLLGQFPNRKLAVADTMNLWIEIAKDELTALLKTIDGLVLNYDEAEQYTGMRNPVSAGRKLLELGLRFVVVKKGEHGAILIHEDGLAAMPAYPTEDVVDPTGAGDSFAGGMMAAIDAAMAADASVDPGSFEQLRRAMAHGTITASFTIESFGLDRLRSLETAEIDARYTDFARMMHLGEA